MSVAHPYHPAPALRWICATGGVLVIAVWAAAQAPASGAASGPAEAASAPASGPADRPPTVTPTPTPTPFLTQSLLVEPTPTPEPTPTAVPATGPASAPGSAPASASAPAVIEVEARVLPTPTPQPLGSTFVATPLAAVPTATPSPTPTAPAPLPPDFSQDQIVAALMADRPVNRPLPPKIPEDYRYPTESVVDAAPGRVATASPRLLREGEVLTDRRARLVKDPDGGYSLAFEKEGHVLRTPPIQLIPNQLLEQMLAVSQGQDDLVFEVSGVVTRFQGRNYLLLQRALVSPDLGNLR